MERDESRREKEDYDWGEGRSYWNGKGRRNKIKNRNAGFSEQRSFSVTKLALITVKYWLT